MRRRRYQQRSPPCSVVIDVRLHHDEESVRYLQGREDGEAIDLCWSNGSYNFVNVRDSIGNKRWIVYAIGVTVLLAQGTKKTYHNNGGSGIGSGTGCWTRTGR
jgi:hypothetical protein